MSSLLNILNTKAYATLSPEEVEYIRSAEVEMSTRCSLHFLWLLMDRAWDDLGIDEMNPGEELHKYYSHPVWLLNGLYGESDTLTETHRSDIASWASTINPKRIADLGGGFGGLSRKVAHILPQSTVEVIEPFPHGAALALAEGCDNLSYEKDFDGLYSLIMAVDVLEHLIDPLDSVLNAIYHLEVGGHFLFANCFKPVIKCHLSHNNHFDMSWSTIMHALGLGEEMTVSYGSCFIKVGEPDIELARRVEVDSFRTFQRLRHLPSSRVRKAVFELYAVLLRIIRSENQPIVK